MGAVTIFLENEDKFPIYQKNYQQLENSLDFVFFDPKIEAKKILDAGSFSDLFQLVREEKFKEKCNKVLERLAG